MISRWNNWSILPIGIYVKSGLCLWLTGEKQHNNRLYYVLAGSTYFKLSTKYQVYLLVL